METRSLDIRHLIEAQIADDKGKSLPKNAVSGELQWSTPGRYKGVGRMLVSSPGIGLARNFSCGECIEICGVSFDPDSQLNLLLNGTGPLGDGIPQECIDPGCACAKGTPTSDGGGGSSFSWWSQNRSIANVSGSTTNSSANFQGFAPGTTTGEVEVSDGVCQAVGRGPITVVSCPSNVSVDQITPKSLPDHDQPTWLTGVGILARMKVGPAGTDYTGAVMLETVTPTSNSCPSNIQQYTSFPTITAANNSTFTVGSSASWEGSNFPSMLNDFYDSHRNLVNINVLGLTSVQSCVAKATQTYSCKGSTIGTFALTNTYTRGTLNGHAVTNVSTTKQ